MKIKPMFLLLFVSAICFSADPEHARYEISSRETAYHALGDKYHNLRQSGALGKMKEPMSLWRDFILSYPGTFEAALAEQSIMKYYLSENDFANALSSAERILKNFRTHTTVYMETANTISEISLKTVVSEELRERAMALSLAHCEGNGTILRRLYSILKQKNVDWDTILGYAKLAGKDEPSGMEALYMYYNDFRRNVSASERKKRGQDFMELYGADNPYRILVTGTPDELKGYYRFLLDVKRSADAVKSAMDSGSHDSALKMLEEWKKYPAQACSEGWGIILNNLHKFPDDVVRNYAAVALRIASTGGELRHSFINRCVNDRLNSRTPENTDKIIELYRLFFERQVGCFSAFRMLKWLEGMRFEDGYVMMSENAGRYGLKSYSSMLLFKAARNVWDYDFEKGRELLKAAIAADPESSGGIYAEWWLALIEGRMSISVGASPRKPIFLSESEPPRLACPESKAIPAPLPVPTKTNAFTLPKLKKEIEISGFAPWIPEELPAEKIFALDQVSTVGEIVLTAAEGLHFTLELCSADGSILRFYERAWLFQPQEHLPEEKHVMRLLPCDNVAFVRVRILKRSSEQDGIERLTLSSPPYPMNGLHLGEIKNLDSSAKTIKLSGEEERHSKSVRYERNMERVRHFPAMRWVDPWKPFNNDVVGVGFFGGGTVELSVLRAGVLNFRIDGKDAGSFAKTTEGDEQEKIAVADPGVGRHVISFHSTALPRENEKHVGNKARVHALTVNGEARAVPCVRFLVNGRWTDFLSGETVAIPDGASKYQGAIWFDSRSVLGQEAALFYGFSAVPSDGQGEKGVRVVMTERPVLVDDADSASAFVAGKRPAVVYPKNGTKGEYEIAKRIADKAGCFLVSDDTGLNAYPGPYLVIGTPFNNRWLRQLSARRCVWEDAAFLNSKDGFCGVLEDDGAAEGFAYAVGQTSEAAVKAAERMLGKVPLFRANTTYRLFEQSLLIRLHQWQLHAEKAELDKLGLIMARSDRRNMSFGIAYEQEAESVKVEASELKNGKYVLSAPQVRFAGFYEYLEYFGDLTMPDILVDKPVLPAPANSSQLVIMTVRTPENTVPGIYRGSVRVEIDGKTRLIPIETEVIGGALKPGSLAFNDYAVMPYYYHDTPIAKREFTSLMANLADHGVSMPIIVGDDDFSWKTDGNKVVFDFSRTGEKIGIADREFSKRGMPQPQIFFTLPDGAIRSLASRMKIPWETVAESYSFQFKAWLDANKLYDRVYCSLGDEVLGVIDKWVEWAKVYRKGGLKIFVTHAHEKMDEVNAAWCPNYAHKVLDMPILAEALKAKQKPVWWYSCAGGGPSVRITGNIYETLPFYWLTAKWGLAGAFSNAALHTTETYFPVPFRREQGCDTRILFLPDGTLLDTVRREVEAEGIQDALLLHARRNAPGTEEILQRIVPSKWQYERDPLEWERARNAVYSAWKNEPAK